MYKRPLTKNQQTSTLENVSIKLYRPLTEGDTIKNKLETIQKLIILILKGDPPNLSYTEAYCLREELAFLPIRNFLNTEIEKQIKQIINTTLTEIFKLINTNYFLSQFNNHFEDVFSRVKLIDKLFYTIEQRKSCVNLCKYLNNYCSSYIYS